MELDSMFGPWEDSEQIRIKPQKQRTKLAAPPKLRKIPNQFFRKHRFRKEHAASTRPEAWEPQRCLSPLLTPPASHNSKLITSTDSIEKSQPLLVRVTPNPKFPARIYPQLNKKRYLIKQSMQSKPNFKTGPLQKSASPNFQLFSNHTAKKFGDKRVQVLRDSKIHKASSLYDLITQRRSRPRKIWLKEQEQKQVNDTLSNLLAVSNLYNLKLQQHKKVTDSKMSDGPNAEAIHLLKQQNQKLDSEIKQIQAALNVSIKTQKKPNVTRNPTYKLQNYDRMLQNASKKLKQCERDYKNYNGRVQRMGGETTINQYKQDLAEKEKEVRDLMKANHDLRKAQNDQSAELENEYKLVEDTAQMERQLKIQREKNSRAEELIGKYAHQKEQWEKRSEEFGAKYATLSSSSTQQSPRSPTPKFHQEGTKLRRALEIQNKAQTTQSRALSNRIRELELSVSKYNKIRDGIDSKLQAQIAENKRANLELRELHSNKSKVNRPRNVKNSSVGSSKGSQS